MEFEERDSRPQQTVTDDEVKEAPENRAEQEKKIPAEDVPALVKEKEEKKKKKRKKTKNTETDRAGDDSTEESGKKSSKKRKKSEEKFRETGDAEKNIVLPKRVQVNVKKEESAEEQTPPGTGSSSAEEYEPNIVKIKMNGPVAGEINEDHSEVVTDFQGARVEIGATRAWVAPVVPVTRLPAPALKIRNITGEIRDITTEIIPDKVIIQGILHKQVFFVGTDGVIRHFAEDIPFSTFVEIPRAEPGMNVQVHPVVEKILFRLAEDGRSVFQKIIIEVFVKVTQFIQTGLELGEGPLLLLPAVTGEATKQHLVENIVKLSIPAEKVDEIRGELRDLQVEVIPDKVIVQGIIHKQLFFVDQRNLARHQEEEVPFSLFLDIPGAEPGMEVQVHPVIEKIFFELLSPDEVREKVIIEVFVKVTEMIQERVQTGDGPLFKVEQVIGEGQEQLLKESVLELERPAVKVREIVGEVRNVSAQVIPDKVIIQGILHKQIFFISADNIERHQMEEIPFSLFIDIPGAAPGLNANVKILIEQILFKLTADRILEQKVILLVKTVITETIQIRLVTGDFSLFKLEEVVGEGLRQLLVEKVEVIPVAVRAVEVVRIVPPAAAVVGRQQIIVENVVELPEKAIKIREVRGEITDLRARIIADDKVLVEGFVHKQVFFVNRENVVQAVTENVPFSVLVTVPGLVPDTPIAVEVEIENISFTLSPDGRFLRQLIVLVAEVRGEVPTPEPFDVVTNVTGPGIVTERILVRAPVLRETGVVVEEFFVVTDVSGPGILRVDKAVVSLDVVDDGIPEPVPIEVVTNVIFEPARF